MTTGPADARKRALAHLVKYPPAAPPHPLMSRAGGRWWQVGEVVVTRQKAHILSLLLTHPDGLTREELMAEVWDDGGPSSLERVCVHVRGLNRALIAFGVPARVVASHGRYSRYAIVRDANQ